jgi:hypothetical protein
MPDFSVLAKSRSQMDCGATLGWDNQCEFRVGDDPQEEIVERLVQEGLSVTVFETLVRFKGSLLPSCPFFVLVFAS